VEGTREAKPLLIYLYWGGDRLNITRGEVDKKYPGIVVLLLGVSWGKSLSYGENPFVYCH
jgi:hypothetical protein